MRVRLGTVGKGKATPLAGFGVRFLLAAEIALGVASAPSCWAEGLRIIQLDLARMPEPVPFISNYIDHVSAWGYDTLQLYLEGRVATRTFTIPNARHYSVDEMRGIVAHAAEKGMMVVPVVSFLAHAEHFFRDEALMNLCETREGTFRVPFRHDTFCYSQPATLSFVERYVADLCDVFTGPYFHVGFDEAWNTGVCSLCSKRDGSELFAAQIKAVHSILARHGKRMMMWDDFFEFYRPALLRIPRDIVMMHWNYAKDISDRGARVFLPGSLRRDSLAEYASLGFDAIPCSWYPCDNIRSFVGYSRRSRTMGYLQTQWEDLVVNFHGGSLPRVLAVSKILDDPALDFADDAFLRAIRQLAPSLSKDEAAAAARLLESPDDAFALSVLSSSSCAVHGGVDRDPFSERAIVDELICRSQAAVLENKVKKAEKLLSDPRRDDGDLAAVRKLLKGVPDAAECLAARRKAQCEMWRNGYGATGMITGNLKKLGQRARALVEDAKLALPTEKRLEVEFLTADRWARPTWKVEGEFSGRWREISSFTLLHGEDRRADFTLARTFTADSLPSKLRLSHKGYGTCQLRFVSVSDRESRCVPSELIKIEGNVETPGKMLIDDYSAATFGREGFLAQFNDKSEANRISSVVLTMRKDEIVGIWGCGVNSAGTGMPSKTRLN